MDKIHRLVCDVAVIGGGIAGIAAALSGAELGKDVILVEPSFLLGGLATSGLVTIYLPLCDGCGRQVSFSIAERLLRLSVSHGAEAEYPAEWFDPQGSVSERIAHRYRTQYNAQVFAMLAEKALTEAGVRVLLGTTLTDAQTSGKRVMSATLHSRANTLMLTAKTWVDATGDATLCALAGAETALSEHGNRPAWWFYDVKNGEYALKMRGMCDFIQTSDIEGGFVGIDAEELSRVTLDAHSRILEDFFADGDVSPSHALATVATIPQVRITRRIIGRETMQTENDHKPLETSVGMISDWLHPGPVYDVPMGALIGDLQNVAVAGRCISVADDRMWDVTRVIPPCAVTGEAAGVMAALTDDFDALDVRGVQSILTGRGVKLHFADVCG